MLTDSIFIFCQPIIILKEGFHLDRKYFFKNLSFVIGYGFIGTLQFVSLFIIAGYQIFVKLITDQLKLFPIKWTLEKVIQLASILVTTDTLAPLALIDSGKYPDLFTVLFGEGVMNDAVGLVIFKIVEGSTEGTGGEISSQSKNDLSMILVQFVTVGLTSVAFGLLCGQINSYYHKIFRSMRHYPPIEVITVVLSAFITYCATEKYQSASGVVAIFIFGIVQKSVNMYNLSKEGIEHLNLFLDITSYLAEAYILVFLGMIIPFLNFIHKDSLNNFVIFQETFIYALVSIFIIILCRFVVVFFIYGVLRLFTCNKNQTIKEILIVAMSGMIKGTLAQAQSLKLERPRFSTRLKKSEVHTNSKIFLNPITNWVVLLTMFTFTPLNDWAVNKLLAKKKEEEEVEEEVEVPETRDSKEDDSQVLSLDKTLSIAITEKEKIEIKKKQLEPIYESGEIEDKEDSPNKTKQILLSEKKKRSCYKRFKENCFFPFFVYNYHNRKKKGTFKIIDIEVRDHFLSNFQHLDYDKTKINLIHENLKKKGIRTKTLQTKNQNPFVA